MSTPETVENPYAAPQSPIVFDRTGEPGAGLRWHLAWATVFGVNLIVPLWLGWDMTSGVGRVGLVLAIVLWLLLGHLLCARSRKLRFLLVAGGVCVGLSQLLPLLQIWAGMNSGMIISMASGFSDRATGLYGFLMTLLTGGQLILVAIVSGQVVFLMKNAWGRRRR